MKQWDEIGTSIAQHKGTKFSKGKRGGQLSFSAPFPDQPLLTQVSSAIISHPGRDIDLAFAFEVFSARDKLILNDGMRVSHLGASPSRNECSLCGVITTWSMGFAFSIYLVHIPVYMYLGDLFVYTIVFVYVGAPFQCFQVQFHAA